MSSAVLIVVGADAAPWTALDAGARKTEELTDEVNDLGVVVVGGGGAVEDDVVEVDAAMSLAVELSASLGHNVTCCGRAGVVVDPADGEKTRLCDRGAEGVADAAASGVDRVSGRSSISSVSEVESTRASPSAIWTSSPVSMADATANEWTPPWQTSQRAAPIMLHVSQLSKSWS